MTFTNRYAIRRPDDHEPLADVALRIREALDDIDYALGEFGLWTPAGAAGTTTATIVCSRAYPTGFRVGVSFRSVISAGTANCWGTAESGTGGPGGVAQFEIGLNSSTATARQVVWHVLPNP